MKAIVLNVPSNKPYWSPVHLIVIASCSDPCGGCLPSILDALRSGVNGLIDFADCSRSGHCTGTRGLGRFCPL